MTETTPFSEEAQNVLSYAHQLAIEYGHAAIFPEHLLLSISAYRAYGAFQVLDALKVNMDKLGEQCQLSIAKQAAFINVPPGKGVVLSPDIQTILEQAKKTAIGENQPFMSTVHLLLGLMAPKLQSGAILREQGATAEQVQTLRGALDTLPPETAVVPPHPIEKGTPVKRAYHFQISPVFLTLVGITVLAGVSAFNGWISPAISVFLFVTGGWVVSLCLHEFGHAVVAYWAGDDTVIDKGYLTLNPLKYTHGVLSIVFPILIVMMGGIGLPGGAVYINRGLIRHRYQHSLVSAAGPFATGVFALLLAIPFLLGIHTGQHFAFWAGMAMLAFLQVTALFFNLLPLPGLDGFGILAPYLPEEVLRIAYSFGQFSYILIFILFFYNNGFREWFWGNIFQITTFLGIDPFLFFSGLQLFRFWQQ